jgi:hypothetical protein
MTLAIFFILEQNGVRFDWLGNHLSELAAGLVVAKFLLAGVAFRVCLQRRLLPASCLIGYLVVWCLLVGALLATLLTLARPDRNQVLPACLGVILLVPLARIGFAPMTLAQARHNAES